MDIQRKAFEESNNVNPDWSFKFDEELQQYVAVDFEMTNQVDEFNEHWDTFRAGWDAKAQAVPETQQTLHDLLLVKSIRKHVERHISEISVNGLFDEGWLAAMKCIQNNIDMLEAQDLSNNATPELVNNDVTYVIELKGYEAIENARVALKKKGYKTWDYTDKDSIDDNDLYVLCVCPSTPNDSALVKGTFKSIHQGKFTYIQTDLESCPDAQEPAND